MWRTRVLGAICLLTIPFVTASAQTPNLIFTTIASPTAEFNQRGNHAWAERVNAQAHGIFTIDVRDGTALLSNPDFYDRLRDDVVQISSGSLNYISGKFRLAVFTALPFLMESAEEESVVFWRVYRSGALDSEFDELMPLFIRPFPQSILHLKKQPPGTLDDLKGLRIIASGQLPTQLMSRLGASPISIPLSDSYLGLQRGLADGIYYPWSGFTDAKLNEVTTFHIEAPLGGGPGGVWMMKKKYQSLSPAIRKIIDDNSGEAESRIAGALMDELNQKTARAVKATPGQTAVDLTPDQNAKWRAMVEPMLTEWANISPEHAKVLTAVRKEIANYRAER